MWILTREINEYDQDGEYFVDAWENYPSVESLMKATSCDEEYCIWLQETGGGRKKYGEWEWFHFRKHETTNL